VAVFWPNENMPKEGILFSGFKRERNYIINININSKKEMEVDGTYT
jgi:hypothetical protein